MPIPFPARILIADDHAVVREGIKAMLEKEPDLTVVAEAEDGLEAVQKATSEDVHLAVLDVAMPALTGLQAAREIAARRPDLPILILSMYDREQYFFEALAAGASGYVLKREADRDVVEACRAALRGQPFVYPKVMSALMQRYLERTARGERPGRGPLTPRETEVVKLIAEGRTSQEIAELLVISPKTVERHRANVLEKLGMRDRVEVTRYAIREGLVEP
ncbi:MAG TPA: response regulator transcription factor [Gaiellaceae bacterium]|jgi:DNA-binding NarL/FixJ family response regulator|nr:response regulator transcription factor [Gaiellaceae bacterium]